MQVGEDWEFVDPDGQLLSSNNAHERNTNLWMGGHLCHSCICLKEKWQLKDKSNNELDFTFESLISFFYCILPFDRH